MNDKVTAELEARQADERAKALRKYGAEALVPTGRPDYDVADYAINEIIGLIRYAEMLHARAEMMDKLFEGADRRRMINLIREQRMFSEDLRVMARVFAERLIFIRQRMIAKGLHLGLTEAAS